MAVVWVRQVFDEERAAQSKKDKSVTLVYKVLCDDKTDTAVVARNAVTTAGASITVDGDVLEVKDLDARRDPDHPCLFIVLVNCGTPEKDDPSSEKWDARFSSSGVAVTETISTDKNGNPIVNGAGQSLDPAIEKTYYDEQVTVSYKTNTPPTAIDDCRGKLNDAEVSFTIAGLTKVYPAKTLRMETADYSHSTQDDATVWDISMVFVYRRDGWVHHVLNQGFYEKVGGELFLIYDDWGNPLNSPSWLDGAGAHSATPQYLDFETEDTASFDGLFDGIS